MSGRIAWVERLATWLLPALGFLMPLAFSTGLADSFELTKLIVLQAGLALAFLGVVFGATLDSGALRAPAALATLLFLGVNGAAALGGVAPWIAVFGSYQHDQGLLTLATQIAYFLLAASWIRTPQALARLVAGVALAAACTSLYAIAQRYGLDPWGWSALTADGRPTTGSIGNPNNLAEFLTLTIPLTAWLAWHGRGTRRDLALWALAPQPVALVFTQARTALLTVLLLVLLAAALGVCLYWRRLQGLAWPLALGLQFAPLVATIILLGSHALGTQVDSATRTLMNRGSPLQSREYLWGSAAAAATARPVLGWGPDSFALVYPGYRSVALDTLESAVGRDDAVHNILLTTAVNAGGLGVVALLLVQLAVAATLLRGIFGGRGAEVSRPPPALALALLLVWCGYAVLFAIGEARVPTDWLWWVVGGAAVGLFGAPGQRPWRVTGVLRAIPAILAITALSGAVTAAVADAAYLRSAEQSPAAAAATLRLAIGLHPFEPIYHQELGVRLDERAQESSDAALFGEALDQLGGASQLWGGHEPYVLSRLGRVTVNMELASGKTTDAALGYLRGAIALDPQNPLLYASASEICARQGRADEARTYWAAGWQRAHSADAFQRLGAVAVRLGDLPAARMAYRTAAERQWRPALQAPLYRDWGNTAQELGLWDEAADAYGQALAREPDDEATRLKRAQVLAAGGRQAEALAEARIVLAQSPTNSPARDLVAQLTSP